MTKKRFLIVCFLIVFAVLVDLFVWKFIKTPEAMQQDVVYKIEFYTDTLDQYQVFYSKDDEFVEKNSSKASVDKKNSDTELIFSGKAMLNNLRVDFGTWSAHINIKAMSVEYEEFVYDIPLEIINQFTQCNDIKSIVNSGDGLDIVTNSGDAYIVFEPDAEFFLQDMQNHLNSRWFKIRIVLCIVIDLLIILIIFNMQPFIDIAYNAIYDKNLIFSLAKSDFKKRYAGSYFGMFWAFVQPVIMMLVYWFALDIGLRSGDMLEYPFVLWLMGGLVPWFFFSEGLGSGASALTEYSYLVKKVVFKIDILPAVKIISAIFIHLFFVLLLVILHAVYGYYPDLYTIQLIYYILCMFVFLLAISYITSSIVVFFKDLNQIIGIILQVGIWATPIMWDVNILPSWLHTIMKINPVYYVVNGFRDSLLDKIWFWERPIWTICYWMGMTILFIVGRNIFKRLQVHFADVL